MFDFLIESPGDSFITENSISSKSHSKENSGDNRVGKNQEVLQPRKISPQRHRGFHRGTENHPPSFRRWLLYQFTDDWPARRWLTHSQIAIGVSGHYAHRS